MRRTRNILGDISLRYTVPLNTFPGNTSLMQGYSVIFSFPECRLKEQTVENILMYVPTHSLLYVLKMFLECNNVIGVFLPVLRHSECSFRLVKAGAVITTQTVAYLCALDLYKSARMLLTLSTVDLLRYNGCGLKTDVMYSFRRRPVRFNLFDK